MNAEAILTPGGIADQLGGSLSGVAMALQRRSEQNRQMQMQDRQTQQQEFQNAHMLRREERQDRRDGAADALGQRQMTLQEHIQARLEEAGRTRAQGDLQQQGESRRRFDIQQGVLSPAGQQAPPAAANALVGGAHGVALSQDDQAAMRNREAQAVRTAPSNDWRLTPEQRMSENEKDRAAADGRQDRLIQSRENTLAMKDWSADRKAALGVIEYQAMMGDIDEGTRARLISDWEKAHPKPPGGAESAGQPPAVDQNARRKAAWDSTP